MIIHRGGRRESQGLKKQRVVLLSAFLCVLCGVTNGQQREVPGDRFLLDRFSFDRDSSKLRWTVTVGALDEKGEYRAEGKPVSCALEFNFFRFTCGESAAPTQFSPAGYADAANEFNAVMEHMYRIAALVEQERRNQSRDHKEAVVLNSSRPSTSLRAVSQSNGDGDGADK